LNFFLDHRFHPKECFEDFQCGGPGRSGQERDRRKPRHLDSLIGGGKIFKQVPKQVCCASRAAIQIDLTLGDCTNVNHAQSKTCSDEEDDKCDSSPQSEEALATKPWSENNGSGLSISRSGVSRIDSVMSLPQAKRTSTGLFSWMSFFRASRKAA
jgi:hypothetical protein